MKTAQEIENIVRKAESKLPESKVNYKKNDEQVPNHIDENAKVFFVNVSKGDIDETKLKEDGELAKYLYEAIA